MTKWQLSVAILLLASTGVAREPEKVLPGFHLSWVRTDEASACVDASRVQADVEQRLSGSPREARHGFAASVESVVVRTESGWKATIVVRRADGTMLGTRDVESQAATCDSLARASALAIAVMLQTIEPKLTTDTPEPSPLPQTQASEPLVVAAPLVVAGVGGPRQAQPDEDWALELQGGLVCALGVLPGIACGAKLANELAVDRETSVHVAVHFLPERSLSRAGANASFGLTFAELGLCRRIDLGVGWSVAPCAGLAFGALDIAIEQPTPASTGQRLWVAGAAGLRLGWRTGRVQVHAAADALLPFDRHEYVVEGADGSSASLFVEPPLAAMGTLAGGLRF